MNKIALIDADVLAYMVGFASQRSVHYFKMEGKLIRAKAGLSKTDILSITEGKSIEFIKKDIDPDPDHLTLHKLRLVIKSILENCGTKSYEAYLTKSDDSTQFRKNIAKTLEYKGNRKNMERPFHYALLRDTLQSKYEANLINYYEADDILAIRHTTLTDTSILCTIDKDLKQVPGTFYDIKRKEFIQITQERGDLQLCKQWITGDKTDNIPGIPGYAEKRAIFLLENGTGYPKSSFDKKRQEIITSRGLNLQTWYDIIKLTYEELGEDRMWEVGNLVFMVRKRGQPLKGWLIERGVRS